MQRQMYFNCLASHLVRATTYDCVRFSLKMYSVFCILYSHSVVILPFRSTVAFLWVFQGQQKTENSRLRVSKEGNVLCFPSGGGGGEGGVEVPAPGHTSTGNTKKYKNNKDK